MAVINANNASVQSKLQAYKPDDNLVSNKNNLAKISNLEGGG